MTANKSNPLTAHNLDIPAITRGKGGANKKYRPSLTSAQIAHILALAKTEAPNISEISFSLISALAPFQAKIENDGISVAYETKPAKPKANSLEALGVATSKPEGLAKEEHWLACYDFYILHGAEACSLQELTAVAEHRYLNDLMTPEEERVHESK